MRRLIAFEQVSLDGYFVDANGDMSWAHKQDPEWNAFVAGNASGDGALLFGRVTYEMMASFWPTPAALERAPGVAEGMNELPKVVFSRTLDKATWKNTTLVKGELAAEVRRMKKESGPDMAILGSGRIVSQLAQAGLIDDDAQARSTVDAVARRSFGKLVAFLAAQTRDVAAAEDALSEAFASALL